MFFRRKNFHFLSWKYQFPKWFFKSSERNSFILLFFFEIHISEGVFRKYSMMWFCPNENFPRGFSRKYLEIYEILKWKSIQNQYKESRSTILKTSENEVSLRASQEKFSPAPRGGQTRAPKETLFSKWFRKKICQVPKQ